MEVSADHINVFLSKCRSSNWAGVFFSHPFQTHFQFWLQDLEQPVKSSGEKFIFSPFDIAGAASLILQPSQLNEDAIEKLGQTGPDHDYWQNTQLTATGSTSREQYDQQFSKYISTIRSGKCSKAILSTVLNGNLPGDFNIGEYICRLRKAYPQAFVYVLSAPFAGTWVGATPESLLTWKDHEVSTMSLAGTKKTADTHFSFGNKEKNEQEIVTNYISGIFKDQFLNVEVFEREELSYGEMTHLLSRVKAPVNDSYTSEQFLQLAKLLHPTPAVGGFPVDPALELIRSTEGHARLYYSGYLGVVGQQFAELVVNLRCMTLIDGAYYAFAGGGITAGSDADAEWAETRLKAGALLKFL